MTEKENQINRETHSPNDDLEQLQNIIGLGQFSARKSYYPELQKKIEELEAERDKAQTYLDIAGVMFIALDREGTVILANRKVGTLLGYDQAEIVGRNWFDHFVPANLKEKTNTEFNRLMAGEFEQIEYTENLILTQDGVEKMIAWHHTVLKDADGTITGTLSSGEDITERKRAEAALQKYAYQLETLNTVTATLTTSLALDKVLQLILDQIRNVIAVESAAVFLKEEQGICVVVDWGFTPSLVGQVFPMDTLFTKPEQSGEPLILDQPLQDPHFQNWGNSETLQCWMGVPLIARDKLIGFLTLDSDQPRAFSFDQVSLIKAFAAQASQAIDNAQQFSTAQRRLEHLESLRQIDQTISNSLDLRVTLRILLEQGLQQLQVDAAAVLLYQPEVQRLEFVAGQGFRTQALRHANFHLGKCFAGTAVVERRFVQVTDWQQIEKMFSHTPDFHLEQFVTYMGMPLIAKGSIIGVLEIYHRQTLETNMEWISFLNTLAGQAAIAIDNIHLFNDLQTSNLELRQAYDATIEGWAHALELRDFETEGHSRRVVDMTLKLARELGIERSELAHIRRGALLHDIGKMGIPDAILQKNGKLNEEEWAIMRQHPVYAYEMLRSIPYLQPALDIPYCHHEKWDGLGYPRNLEGHQIPLVARIFAIVDVWDALSSDRPYRKAWSNEKIYTYLQEQSGKSFDPQVVDAFWHVALDNG